MSPADWFAYPFHIYRWDIHGLSGSPQRFQRPFGSPLDGVSSTPDSESSLQDPLSARRVSNLSCEYLFIGWFDPFAISDPSFITYYHISTYSAVAIRREVLTYPRNKESMLLYLTNWKNLEVIFFALKLGMLLRRMEMSKPFANFIDFKCPTLWPSANEPFVQTKNLALLPCR